MFSTVNPKTGFHGLWKLGERMNAMALSWKYLHDVQEEDVGINEVEAKAWKR